MATLPGTRVRDNGIFGTILNNPLTVGATVLNSAELAELEGVSGDHAIVTLDPNKQFGSPEIVMITSHTPFATVAVIQRGMYGTTPRQHPLNTAWVHAAVVEDFIDVVTSVTRPVDPYEGQLIYETDTQSYQSWDGGFWVGIGGSATIFQDPDPPPGPVEDTLWLDTDEGAGVGLSSIIGYSQAVANQAGITALVDLTGLSVNISVPAGRRIRISGRILQQNNTADGRNTLSIFEGGTQVQFEAQVIRTANSTIGSEVSVVISPSAGTHTYNLKASTTIGTMTMIASATAPAYILVEDITGTLWPAGQSIGAGAIAPEPWQDYVPSNANVTIGNGTQIARYVRVGRIIFLRYSLVWGTTTAFTGSVEIGLPVQAASGGPQALTGSIVDSATRVFIGMGEIGATSALTARVNHTESTNIGIVNATAPMTWTTGDRLVLSGSYEAVV